MKEGVVRAGIVVTGTEVITARITDINGPWVSEQLAGLGIEVAHIIVVADRPDDLEHALRFLDAEGMDLIVTSGGLGPTADDLTAEVVGRFAGREMKLDLEMEAKIAAILRRFAKTRAFKVDEAAVMDANRKQAMVPEGAEALDPVGTAPGLVVPFGDGPGRVVIVLPGPPRELQPMWPVALATDGGEGRAGADDAAARADDADVRRPRVGNRQEPAGDRGRRRGRRRGGRGDDLPAARRDRDRRALARGDRGGGDGGPRRAPAAPPAGDLQPRRRRRSTSRWRSC